MDKPRPAKPKTIQMKYPAPYSQSWASPEPKRKADKLKKKSKKNYSSVQPNMSPRCCHRKRPKPLHGSDPYAPHLKYGIFPNQSQKLKHASMNDNAKPSARNAMDSSPDSELIDKGDKKAKKDQLSDTPLFVIRPIDKRHRRQLSLSETIHLDIKPRKNIRSPVRKYSALFNNAIPRINAAIEY